MSGEDARMARAQERHDAAVEARNLDVEEAELVEDMWLDEWEADRLRRASSSQAGIASFQVGVL